MRILWLSHFVPFPPKGGCFQRNYNLISRLGARHEVHLIAMRHKRATHPEAELAVARSELQRFCRSVDIVDIAGATEGRGQARRIVAGLLTGRPFNVTVYESDEMRDRIRSACGRAHFDLVHFDTIGLAQYIDVIGDVPTAMTHHGAESFMVRRRIRNEPSVLRKGYFVFEWLALRRYEQLMCGRFDVNICMSDDDGRLLAAGAADARFVTVANGVDVQLFRPVAAKGHRTIVFAGRLDQYSNRHGMLHFVEKVWPIVSGQYPDAACHIIGNNPPEQLRMVAARDSRVKVHGFVPDIRPYFEEACVAICPVRDGGGTRIKILDALAMGMPVVSTSIGCEGIAVVPERHLLIGDSPDEFARQIGRVFDDPSLRARLASEGRRLVERTYSWDALTEQLISQYENVAEDWRRSA